MIHSITTSHKFHPLPPSSSFSLLIVSVVVSKSLTPPPLKPLRHLWTTPYCVISLKLPFNACFRSRSMIFRSDGTSTRPSVWCKPSSLPTNTEKSAQPDGNLARRQWSLTQKESQSTLESIKLCIKWYSLTKEKKPVTLSCDFEMLIFLCTKFKPPHLGFFCKPL